MLLCVRTTIRLDDAILSEAKKVAAEQRTTLTAVIENALRQSFAQRQHAVQRGKVSFTTSGKGGLRPGVDLDDSAALLELMEQAHDTR